MRKITILGATGSVGQSTIKVIKAQDTEGYEIQALTANSNVELLAKQAIELNARRAVVADETHYAALKDALAGTGIEACAGEDAVIEAAQMPADWIMCAIVGMAGLKPLMAGIEQGRAVAIANKEPLVAAGPFVIEAARKYGAQILPIDSEHNAVFQVFEPENKSAIERIILTASGGPFREMSAADMTNVSVEQALAHPNWKMGAKISIDSATMMNKALEIIEAQRLFDVSSSQIEVLVHPQSVVHSMIEYCDGSFLAQMGASDMCTPITNALGYPKRLKTPGEKLDLAKMSQLDFHPVDNERFPFVKMAYDALESGLEACITMNAANEMAVAAFLAEKIKFMDIYKTVETVMHNLEKRPLNSLNDVVEYDSFVRFKTDSLMMENI